MGSTALTIAHDSFELLNSSIVKTPIHCQFESKAGYSRDEFRKVLSIKLYLNVATLPQTASMHVRFCDQVI